jgi:hypothetical protein
MGLDRAGVLVYLQTREQVDRKPDVSDVSLSNSPNRE